MLKSHRGNDDRGRYEMILLMFTLNLLWCTAIATCCEEALKEVDKQKAKYAVKLSVIMRAKSLIKYIM